MGGPNRRGFLRNAGLAGAGAAALGAAAAGPALVAGPAAAAAAASGDRPGRWNPDPESLQFTTAVMPDTQFLYFYPSIKPEPQAASFRYILDAANDFGDNIVFMAHLGDLTEDGLAS